jgi:hypothetical protein
MGRKTIVNVADTLQLVQRGLESKEESTRDAAETVLSALIFSLRNRQAVFNEDVSDRYHALQLGGN